MEGNRLRRLWGSPNGVAKGEQMLCSSVQIRPTRKLQRMAGRWRELVSENVVGNVAVWSVMSRGRVSLILAVLLNAIVPLYVSNKVNAPVLLNL